MALIFDAHTSPRRCRPGTHDFSSSDRCTSCRALNVPDAVAGETMATGGYPVAYLETRPRYTETPRPTDTCGKGHEGNWYTDSKGRHCRDCRNARQRRFKARRRAVAFVTRRAAA